MLEILSNTRRWIALAAILLFVAGCGSSGSSSSSGNGSESIPDPEPEPLPGLAELPIVPMYVRLDPRDLDELYARDPMSSDRLDARVRLGNPQAETQPIEIRFRGSSTRLLPKKSFNIRFREGQEFLFGSSRMNANAMYTDPSMMRETLAWAMFAELDRPAPRARYADIHLNGIYEGLAIHIERVDSNLLEHAGLNPGGTLVRDEFRDLQGVDPRVDVVSAFAFPLSELDESERAAFLADGFGSRGSPDWDSLVDLIVWVQGSQPGARFEAEFRQRFHADIFTDWLAVHFLIADIDSFADDYWLYLDHGDETARWVVIPWDKDLSFGSHFREGFGIANDFFTYEKPVGFGWDNPLVDLYLNTPGLRAELQERMRLLMSEVFPLGWFETRVAQTWDDIRDSALRQPGPRAFVKHPQNHFSAQDVPDLHLETLLEFVRLRYAYLDRWLDPQPGPALVAAATIDAQELPQRLALTDASGFTLADIEFLSAPSVAGRLTMQLREDPAQQGIDRVWTLESDLPAFDAILRLYYRNDLPDVFSFENWYTGGLDPVGRQAELVLAERFGSSLMPLEDSIANPYANVVRAPVRIEPGLSREFVLALP